MSVVGWRRKLIDQHLERCLPDLDPPRRRAIARGFYAYLGRSRPKLGHIPGMDEAELAERVRFENPELVAELCAEPDAAC